MIELGKQYRTRDGREVRIYAVCEDDSCEAVHGAILDDGMWHLWGWHKDGRRFIGKDNGADLIEMKPRRRRTIWVNVYSDPNLDRCYITKALANYWCTPNRIACIKVELDFEEGEGL